MICNPLASSKLVDSLPEIVEHYLRERPGSIIWPEEEKLLARDYSKIQKHLDENRQFLVDVGLLGYLALRTGVHEIPEFIARSAMKILALTKEEDLDLIFSGYWTAVPVPNVQGANGTITWFLVGTLDSGLSCASCWPAWFIRHTEPETRQAVYDAFGTAQGYTGIRKDLYLFPIENPTGTWHLGGHSLGLPLALAATAALRNRPYSPLVLATGAVDPATYAIIQVNQTSLVAKAEAGDRCGMRLFLYPASNTLLGPGTAGIDDQRQVATLAEAVLFAELYAKNENNMSDLGRLKIALDSPDSFVNNCGSLSATAIQWALHSPGISRHLATIRSDRTLVHELAGKLIKAIERSTGDYSLASALAVCFSEQEMDEIFCTDPAAGLQWCEANMALACHQGKREEEKKWYEIGCRFEDRIELCEDGDKLFNKFKARFLAMSTLHNAFCFDPELPESFNDILQEEEAVQEARCKHRTTKIPNPLLAKRYGMVAQNYAFCGPKYIEETKQYIEKSLDLFPQNDEKNRKQEFSYLYFALLDSDPQGEEVVDVLLTSLGASDWQELCQDGNPDYNRLTDKRFDLFAIIRALVDIPEKIPKEIRTSMLEYMFSCFEVIPFAKFPTDRDTFHPWQLWTYNLGLLACRESRADLAEDAFKKSITLCCHSPERMTIAVMALLPLAALWKFNPDAEGQGFFATRTEKILELICNSGDLHVPHFQPLLAKKTWTDVLQEVSENTSRFYPFNYR